MSSDATIFADAAALPAAGRAAFLDRACAGDAAMRGRVEALLCGHDAANSFLKQPLATRAASFALPEENAGQRIGRYKLLEKIGEGGCGVVWMAEQSEPVRRRVALKVIKLGMDTKEVIARFEAERQAVALMDHPNIAKVHDGGATESGRPFFVMELVRGLPITRYCDDAKLTPAQRLELFIAVCQAVQHAHQKGVIHRDLKPSNILVTVNDGVALPKVIDFGIAKATQGPLTDKTLFTAFQQFIGTPVYMSPEQADLSSVDIDTRSDIYSLGVLLYELLTGAPPFDAKTLLAGGVDEIRRIIREIEPARPSTRVATLAEADRTTLSRQRSIGAADLSLALRGDLDWIVMRCLEKDRARRYETANALAADLRRHLAHEPVVARPPSTAYLLQKLIRRHRVMFGAAAAIAAALVIGAVLSIWQAVRATRAEDVAWRSVEEQTRLRTTEAAQRQRAEGAEQAIRRRAYVADINLIQQALAADHLSRAQDLLNRQRPKAGEIDLRSWEWRYLWQFCQSDALSVLTVQPDAPINSVAVSADGAWLAAGEMAYGGLSIWNLRTREEIRVPAGRGAVKVTWSPREPLLAIALFADEPMRSRVWLWDPTTRSVVRELLLGSAYCSGMFFSPDGETLVTSRSAQDNEITIWRVKDGEKLAAFPQRAAAMSGGRFSSFAVSRDLTLAAYYTAVDRKLHVFDLKNGRDRWSAVAVDENLLSVAFSPDGKLLVSGAGWSESEIRAWDVDTGAELSRFEGNHRFVGQLVFWPDGRTLVSAGGDHTVRVWDVASRGLIRTLRGHRSEVNSVALLPDARTLVTGGKDGAVMFWNGVEDRVQDALFALPGGPPPSAVQISARSDAIVAVDSKGRIYERRGRRFEEERTLLEGGTPARAVVAAKRPLAAIWQENRIKIWDWERRALVREFALGAGERGLVPVAFAPGDASLMIARGRDAVANWFEEWRLADGVRTREWPLAASAPIPLVSPEGKYFVFPANQGRFTRNSKAEAADEPEAWVRTELATGRVTLLPANTRESADAGAGFSPDGRWFAGGSALGFVDIIDVASWQKVTTLTGVMAGMYRPTFSVDGTRLIVGSSGQEAVTLWDVAGFERLLTLPAGGSVIGVVGFSPDGNLLVARSGQGAMDYVANDGGTLYVWHAPSWAEIEAGEKADDRRRRTENRGKP
jgi:eukaryotic-like serine/threonine-protein kinase